MTGNFQQRLLAFELNYGTGADGLGPKQTFKISGLRATVRSVMAGGLAMGECHVRIFGLTLDKMNQFSTLGMAVQLVRDNSIRVFAGVAGGELALLFSGTIQAAWFNGAGSPRVAFEVIAHAGLIENMEPVAATSYPGPFSVGAAMQNIAGVMGLNFSNHGVDAVLPASYYPGTARAQAYSIAEAANIDLVIDTEELAIWKKGDGARGESGVVLSPDTGLVGYPQFTANGLMVSALFNPALKFGTLVEVAGSILAQANGKWKIVTLTHDLASLEPGGSWFTEMMLVNPAFVVTR